MLFTFLLLTLAAESYLATSEFSISQYQTEHASSGNGFLKHPTDVVCKFMVENSSEVSRDSL